MSRCPFPLLEPNKLRYVVDLVNDVGNLTGRSDHGRIDRAPVPLFEVPSIGLGALNVVLLDGHCVGNQVSNDSPQRGAGC